MHVSPNSPLLTETQPTSFAKAIDAWRQAIGESRVTTRTDRYNSDTSRFTGCIPVALRPTTTEHVQQIVKIAQRFSTPIYPLSTGNNWGYGTSVPVQSPAAIVDLSSMNRILEFDEELGVVTLEPGVTQGELSNYLNACDLPFMAPVTGAGPSCSILANALERGFGVTPITDHFGAVISMKVVLPNGEIFESYTRTFKSAGLAQAFKWGTGPYLDGLFSQSNLGIVVDASIALQARAERSGALLFVLDSNQHVEEATATIRQLLTTAGQNIGAINLMSRNRVECMLRGARNMSRNSGAASINPSLSMPAGAWFGLASVYGCKEHYRATCRLARRRLRTCARRIRIYDSGDVQRFRWLSALAARVGWPQLSDHVNRLEAAVAIVDGNPSTFALRLAYAKSGVANDQYNLNPARDGCGLFWYSPIVPLRRGVVGQFIDFTERTCKKRGLSAPITMTSLTPRCYASTVPLLFDRADPVAELQAIKCIEELHEKGLALGFVPYRVGSQFMAALVRHGNGFWSTVDAVKSAIDPNLVFAPGRYSCSERNGQKQGTA